MDLVSFLITEFIAGLTGTVSGGVTDIVNQVIQGIIQFIFSLFGFTSTP